MAITWQQHDDSTYHCTLGGVLMIAIVFDRLGAPGWKVQVGKRSLKDKLPSKEDAQKVALAFASRILKQIESDLEELTAAMANDRS